MATINVENLLVNINQKLETVTNEREILMLSRAVSVLKTGVVFTVGSFGNLPTASENVGKLYFVEDDSLLYFSFITFYGSVAQWIPITNVSSNVLWTWGNNNGGELGNGTTINRCSPGTIAGGGNTWNTISTGNNSNSGLKTDGTLWTWGCNNVGQLGNGTTLNRSSPGTIAGGGTTWCQVSTSNLTTSVFMSAIKTDGTLWTWGSNLSGRLGDGTTVSRSSPGTIAGGGTTWLLVDVSGYSISAIKTDGTLWSWGRNHCGQLGDGTTVSRSSPGTIAGGGTTWCKIFNENYNSAAIKTDGTLWTWGSNVGGQLGDGTIVARSSPGTVAGGGTTWCNVFGGTIITAAIKTDGTLWTWGSGALGRLGDGTILGRCSPGTTVGGGTAWFQVSGGNFHTIAITKETL